MAAEAKSYRVGKFDLIPCDPDQHDARGIIWMWEEPHPRATYVLGVDPTVGITGWSRHLRTKDDRKTDNGVIEVFRKGAVGEPDVQVAEYAAPIDAIELAEPLNFLGRLYAGANEDGQALVCIEVYPGPGMMTQRELIQRFGYINLPPWLMEGGVAQKFSSRVGWFSTRSTRRDLWVKGVNHLTQKKAILRSPWLIEEMADCTPDNFLSVTARAVVGAHDDRVVAMLIVLWYANEWAIAIEPTEKGAAEIIEGPSWQQSDCTVESMMDEWNNRVASFLDD